MNRQLKDRPVVLIVDDTPSNLGVLVEFLDQNEYTVLLAEDADSAFRRIRVRRPDIILMDVMMPGLDGYETCRRLKRNPLLIDIPVVFMSALTETMNKLKGFEVGGVDYIVKPFDLEEVLARISLHLTVQRQKIQLQELNATKDLFFSIIAHDLRNPFLTIRSYIQLLTQKINQSDVPGLATIKSYSAQLNGVADTTYRLLENLLEWSRLQRGLSRPAFGRVLPAEIVRSILELFERDLKRKEIAVSVDAEADILVTADANMIRTVLRNLLSNAIKFSDRGGLIYVTIRSRSAAIEVEPGEPEPVESDRPGTEGTGAIIRIEDTGVGMDGEQLEGLFRIDRRINTEGTDGERGTGLGMILCKEFVELNGGRIQVFSEKGKGTIVRMSFPSWET